MANKAQETKEISSNFQDYLDKVKNIDSCRFNAIKDLYDYRQKNSVATNQNKEPIYPLSELRHVMLVDYHLYLNENHNLMIYDSCKGTHDYGMYIENYTINGKSVNAIIAEINNITDTFNPRDKTKFLSVLANIQDMSQHAYEAKSHKNYLIDIQRFKPNMTPFNNGIAIKNKGCGAKLIPFSPKYYFRNRFGVDYNKNQKILPTVQQFFKHLVPKDEYRTLRQVVLALYTPFHVRDRLIWFLGDRQGGNGKSTLLSTLENVAQGAGSSHRDNVIANLSATDLNEHFGTGSIGNNLAIIGDDNDTSVPINKVAYRKFKMLTTGDEFSTDVKNKSRKNILFKGLILQSSNLPPQFIDGGGFRRRLLVLKFNHHFSTDKNGNHLDGKGKFGSTWYSQRKVQESIIQWAFDQPDFDSYYQSKADINLTKKVYNIGNPVDQFMYTRFFPLHIHRIPKAILFQCFNEWFKKSQNAHMGKRQFYEKLSDSIKGRYKSKPCRYSQKMQNSIKPLTDSLFYSFQSTVTPGKPYRCLVMLPNYEQKTIHEDVITDTCSDIYKDFKKHANHDGFGGNCQDFSKFLNHELKDKHVSLDEYNKYLIDNGFDSVSTVKNSIIASNIEDYLEHISDDSKESTWKNQIIGWCRDNHVSFATMNKYLPPKCKINQDNKVTKDNYNRDKNGNIELKPEDIPF